MRTCCCLLVAVLFSATHTNAQLRETTLHATLNRATIHLQGVELIQTVEHKPAPGRQRFVFTGLSPKLNPQSVQVTATNGVQILSVTTKTNFLWETEPGPAARQLKDSIELLGIAKHYLNDEKAALEAERSMIMQNQVLSGKDKGVSAEELSKMADFFRSRLNEINNALTDLTRKLGEANVRQGKLKQQVEQLNGGNRPTSEVYVDIDPKNAASTLFKIRYVVNEAGWSPVYDLVSTNINEPIQLKYRALAFNDTGMDWENVAIRLSTADPYQSAGQPSLSPWVLSNTNRGLGDHSGNYYQNNKQTQLELNQQSQNYNFSHDLNPEKRYDQAEAVVKPTYVFETIEISELSTDFDIPLPYTIPADKRPYSIEITDYQLDATYKHVAVPKIDKDAFLIAQVTGWEKLDLISGPVNVYRNENFIGMANLNPRILSDTLELSLGRDANVVVKREKVKEFSRKQFIGGNKFTSFSWKISVKNNHSLPIMIELQDQMPISEAKEITVEVNDVSGARRTENTGKLTWDMNLQPGEVKTVGLNFTVKHPSSMEVDLAKMRTIVSPRYF